MNIRNISITLFCFLSSAIMAETTQDSVMSVNTQPEAKELKLYIPRGGDVEFFAGLDFNYRDIQSDRQYDFLIHLTPGMKWHMGKHFTFSLQALVPIVNNYGDYYKYVSLNVLNVSKEALLWNKLAVKGTVGLFSRERWGLDFKTMLPLAPWIALEGQLGLTGMARTCDTWKISNLNRFYGTFGADFYITRYNTQIRLIGGRFLNTDNGAYLDVMRHFTHCSVGVYGQYSNLATHSNGFNGGFKVVMVIPPYKKRHHRVSFRPASNFRLTYNQNADGYNNKWYDTDPEQNERHGWFAPDILRWGANNIYDFKEKPAKADTTGKEATK